MSLIRVTKLNNLVFTVSEDAFFCRFRSFDIAPVLFRKPADDGYKPYQLQILIHSWRNAEDDIGSINNPLFWSLEYQPCTKQSPDNI